MKGLVFSTRTLLRLLVAVAFVLPLAAGLVAPAAAASNASGAVYTISNAAAGNDLLVYSRSANGQLSFDRAYPTGGLGSGNGLGSQGAVILSANGQWLLAVNAGSNQISVFSVKRNGRLQLTDVVESGGVRPISLAIHKNIVYALNSGESGNIAGFLLGKRGRLESLPGSTQPLSNGGVGAAPGGAQVSFSPDGSTLVVTEKATNLIVTYPVSDGIAGEPTSQPSAGATPFGFAFSQQGLLVVSEAFGGAPGASAVSSYELVSSGLNVISPSVSTTQTAACWVVISNNGKYAYTTNTGSASISSYTIGNDGSLALLAAAAGSTGAGSSPIDMALNNSGKYLYTINFGNATISAFLMRADGSLEAIQTISVPAGALGLAAR